MGSVKRARRLDEELSEHGHAARRDRFRTQKAALENFDDGTSGQHCSVVRRHRRGERRTGVARAAQHSRQPVCQVRATTPTGDPHGAERVRIGGPQADTGGKVAVESRSLPAHDHAETYPAPAGRQRTNAPPTGTAAPRPNGRLARSEASRTPRILGDRHLGSNRGRGAVNDAIRSFDRIYRNCEDPPPGAHTGACSRAASREVWSALGPAMRPPDVTRPPTSLATAKRHRSASAANARSTRGTRSSISLRRPRRRSSAVAGDRSRRQGHPAVAHMRCHPCRLHHRPARSSPLGHDPDRQLHTGPRPGHRAPAGHRASEDRDARHAPTVRHPRDRRGRGRSTGGHRAPPDQKSTCPRRGPNRPADYRWPISVLWPRAFAAPRGASPHPPRVRAMRSPLRWTALHASALESRPTQGPACSRPRHTIAGHQNRQVDDTGPTTADNRRYLDNADELPRSRFERLNHQQRYWSPG